MEFKVQVTRKAGRIEVRIFVDGDSEVPPLEMSLVLTEATSPDHGSNTGVFSDYRSATCFARADVHKCVSFSKSPLPEQPENTADVQDWVEWAYLYVDAIRDRVIAVRAEFAGVANFKAQVRVEI